MSAREAMAQARPHRAAVLPWGVLPRALSRLEAAEYCGISPTTFDRAVNEGKLPKPFRLFGRVLWDVRKLDIAISAMDTEDAAGNDPWGNMAV